MQNTSLKGRLLVATPELTDPNFFRTVLLLLEHGAQGSLGIVLNRPTRAELATTLPDWSALIAEPARFFLGGPVEPQAVIGLGRCLDAPPTEAWQPVLGDVGVVDLQAGPAAAPPSLREVRVFNGYAGWGASQLESELIAGGWLVTDAEPGDGFTSSPDALWSRAQRRPQRNPAWLAGCSVRPPNN